MTVFLFLLERPERNGSINHCPGVSQRAIAQYYSVAGHVRLSINIDRCAMPSSL